MDKKLILIEIEKECGLDKNLIISNYSQDEKCYKITCDSKESAKKLVKINGK